MLSILVMRPTNQYLLGRRTTGFKSTDSNGNILHQCVAYLSDLESENDSDQINLINTADNFFEILAMKKS